MPICEHPAGERHCPNHGAAWADRTAQVVDEIAALVSWSPAEALPEAVERAIAEGAERAMDRLFNNVEFLNAMFAGTDVATFQRAIQRALRKTPDECRCRSYYERTGRHINDCPAAAHQETHNDV